MVVGLVSYAALGSLVGVAVGAVEILQRYRDAPFRAVFNGWGIGYVVLNAAVSYGAFWVLYHRLDTPPGDASGQSDTLHLLGLAAGAGFGGAALIRARLATIRLPSKRCCPSLHTVHELMVGIDFERAKKRLPRELFLAMQSVPEEEAAQVSRPIDEIDRMDDLSSQRPSTKYIRTRSAGCQCQSKTAHFQEGRWDGRPPAMLLRPSALRAAPFAGRDARIE